MAIGNYNKNILLHHDYLQAVHFLEPKHGPHTQSKPPLHTAALCSLRVNLVQHNYMVLPLVAVITCYNSITLYTHIHVDNIEDYGCVDVIYNFVSFDNYSRYSQINTNS